ncbi:MAG: signal peptide peptidase SppA [Rikenellaceae bacterium]
MSFWKTFWACFLAILFSSLVSFVLSFVVLISVIFSIAGVVSGLESGSEQIVKSNSVLTIDLSKQIVEELSENPSDYLDFSTFKFTPPSTLSNTLMALEKAAIDPKIKGVYIKVPLMMANSSTMLYELRCALEQFKKEAPDKFVVSYGENYSQGALYLCSVAQEVFVNPMGGVSWMGMSASSTFYTNTLKKLGIEAEIIRYGKFKGAVEPFMLTKMSSENKEQLQSIIDSNWGYITSQIAEARGVSTESLNAVANNLSAFNAEGAKEAGLVDQILYSDQVEEWMEKRVGDEKLKFISLNTYAMASNSYNVGGDNLVEVIYASGEIADTGSDGIIGTTMANKIKKARKDDKVKAIVLRVNSPGGSALASDVIWREVELAAAEKPLVVSMGNYAASGGYWISAPATKIVASPLTLTGSIGVFGMTFNASKGAEDILGLNFDGVTTNPYADMGSMVRPLSTLERARLQENVNTIYGKFLDKVSQGRGMTTGAVDSIGQGRVWSGLQALENGLVDKLGTLGCAIELAAREAGIENNYRVHTKKSDKNLLMELLSSSASAMIKAFSPSLMPQDMSKIVETIKQNDRKVQARIPLNIEIEY